MSQKSVTQSSRPVALHIASGDLWAGAEVQLYTLLVQLSRTGLATPKAVLLNDGELARRLRAANVAVTILDETKLNALQIVRRLAKLIRELAPDVVHTHRQKENVCGAIANALTIRAPSVRTSHGAPEHKPRGLAQLHKRMFRAFDIFCGRALQQRIIAVSKPLAAELAALFAAERIVVIENGVDIESLRLHASNTPLRVRPDAKHIGIAGRLERVKRVDLFIDACALLLKNTPQIDWQFHVIGNGSLMSGLQERARHSGLEESIIFHGHRTDSAACLASLDALVMCSDHEGMPMTPLEAIAVGTPVVAHAVGGLTDILADEAGGVLVEDHSPQGYAAAILQLLQHQVPTLMERGQARLERRFSAAVNAAKTADLYSQLLASR